MELDFGIIFVLLFITSAFGLCFYLINKFGQGTLTVPFTYFAVGVLLLGTPWIFLHLNKLGIFSQSDITLEIWRHILSYLGMLALIFGGMRLHEISTKPISQGYTNKDTYLLISLFLAALLIFFAAQPLEKTLAPGLKNSFVEKLGLHHLGSFTLAALASVYIYFIKADWVKFLTTSIYPFLVFFLLLTVSHLWLLLTHSLGIIQADMQMMDQIEEVIQVTAFIFLNIAFLRIILDLKSRPQ